MAKYLSGKTVCWLQLKSDGHPASYSQAERLCHPLGFLSELKGKNRDWSCPPRAEVHNETRKKEQTQLLDTPGDVSLVTRGDEGKRKTYWQHPETAGGRQQLRQSSRTRPMLNLKLQRSKFLRANRSQTKIWSGMEHVVTTASWRLWEVKA